MAHLRGGASPRPASGLLLGALLAGLAAALLLAGCPPPPGTGRGHRPPRSARGPTAPPPPPAVVEAPDESDGWGGDETAPSGRRRPLPPWARGWEPEPEPVRIDTPAEPALTDFEWFLLEAERGATPAGRAVLAAAREMIDAGDLVVGSCWSYANAVYDRAGFPNRGRQRETVFKGRKRGPWADPDAFQPGDWLYYVNHSYGDVPHSAIFVGWADRDARLGLMITYRGGRRRVPGQYDTYDLSHVYRVIRPRDPAPRTEEPVRGPGR